MGSLTEAEAEARARPAGDVSSRAGVVRAARPLPAAEREAWETVHVQRSVPLPRYGQLSAAFRHPARADVLGAFADEYLTVLPGLGDGGMTAAMATVLHVFPRHGAGADFPQRAGKAVAADTVTPLVRTQVMELPATLERMVRARML